MFNVKERLDQTMFNGAYTYNVNERVITLPLTEGKHKGRVIHIKEDEDFYYKVFILNEKGEKIYKKKVKKVESIVNYIWRKFLA